MVLRWSVEPQIGVQFSYAPKNKDVAELDANWREAHRALRATEKGNTKMVVFFFGSQKRIVFLKVYYLYIREMDRAGHLERGKQNVFVKVKNPFIFVFFNRVVTQLVRVRFL